MPEIIKAPAGTFCWVESTSRDIAQAQRFYGSIFDWRFDSSPLPGGEPYTRAMLGANRICGFFQMDVPAPFWLSYIAVDDVDASLAKAQTLGATLVKGPVDAGTGRFGILQDPQGATFALWQLKAPMGPSLYGEVNSLCWNELATRDPAAATKFYTALLGWRAETMPMPQGPYTLFKSGPTMQAGGMMKRTDIPPAWAIYFQVAKAEDAAARAQKSGATVLTPVTKTEGVGQWALLKDPQGAAFGLLERQRRGT
jgi:uncharacterized protein